MVPRCIFEYSIYFCCYRIWSHRHSTSRDLCMRVLRQSKSDIRRLELRSAFKSPKIAVWQHAVNSVIWSYEYKSFICKILQMFYKKMLKIYFLKRNNYLQNNWFCFNLYHLLCFRILITVNFKVLCIARVAFNAHFANFRGLIHVYRSIRRRVRYQGGLRILLRDDNSHRALLGIHRILHSVLQRIAIMLVIMAVVNET